jgi:hypothetical protein
MTTIVKGEGRRTRCACYVFISNLSAEHTNRTKTLARRVIPSLSYHSFCRHRQAHHHHLPTPFWPNNLTIQRTGKTRLCFTCSLPPFPSNMYNMPVWACSMCLPSPSSSKTCNTPRQACSPPPSLCHSRRTRETPVWVCFYVFNIFPTLSFPSNT